MKKKISGTREWAAETYNIAKGCKHNCRYCFAHYNSVVRFKTLTEEEWKNPVIDTKKVFKKWSNNNGKTIMFPSTHDIFPEILNESIEVLKKMIYAGNNVLIVSKPHMECISKICATFSEYKDQILFRFTIGALDEKILNFWESGAPSASKRFECLEHAFRCGYKTSVSMEPVLDWPNLVANFNLMSPYVTDSIWVGTMNFVKERVEVKTAEDRKMVDELVKWHTKENFEKVYAELKDNPKIKWKESMKSALGLELATEIGQDI